MGSKPFWGRPLTIGQACLAIVVVYVLCTVVILAFQKPTTAYAVDITFENATPTRAGFHVSEPEAYATLMRGGVLDPGKAVHFKICADSRNETTFEVQISQAEARKRYRLTVPKPSAKASPARVELVLDPDGLSLKAGHPDGSKLAPVHQNATL